MKLSCKIGLPVFLPSLDVNRTEMVAKVLCRSKNLSTLITNNGLATFLPFVLVSGRRVPECLAANVTVEGGDESSTYVGFCHMVHKTVEGVNLFNIGAFGMGASILYSLAIFRDESLNVQICTFVRFALDCMRVSVIFVQKWFPTFLARKNSQNLVLLGYF